MGNPNFNFGFDQFGILDLLEGQSAAEAAGGEVPSASNAEGNLIALQSQSQELLSALQGLPGVPDLQNRRPAKGATVLAGLGDVLTTLGRGINQPRSHFSEKLVEINNRQNAIQNQQQMQQFQLQDASQRASLEAQLDFNQRSQDFERTRQREDENFKRQKALLEDAQAEARSSQTQQLSQRLVEQNRRQKHQVEMAENLLAGQEKLLGLRGTNNVDFFNAKQKVDLQNRAVDYGRSVVANVGKFVPTSLGKLSREATDAFLSGDFTVAHVQEMNSLLSAAAEQQMVDLSPTERRALTESRLEVTTAMDELIHGAAESEDKNFIKIPAVPSMAERLETGLQDDLLPDEIEAAMLEIYDRETRQSIVDLNDPHVARERAQLRLVFSKLVQSREEHRALAAMGPAPEPDAERRGFFATSDRDITRRALGALGNLFSDNSEGRPPSSPNSFDDRFFDPNQEP